MKAQLFTALLSFSVFAATGVSAAVCVPAIEDNVVSSSLCETGSTNNDGLGSPPIQVNVDTMFGISTWVFLAKDDKLNGVDEGADPIGLVLTGGLLAGNWSIDLNAFSLYSSIMMVLKGSAPDPYVGYLLASTSGTYETVFFNKTGKAQEISHISLYGVAALPPAPVPVPGAGLLLVGAIGALAGLRRLKRR